MSSKVVSDTFGIIFPQYRDLITDPVLPANQSIETFLREQLPRKVELVRNMDSCFSAFLTHFSNVILKRPQPPHLVQSLILKAGDKIQKYFNSVSVTVHKLDQNSLKAQCEFADLQSLKRQFKSKLESLHDLLKQKYFGSHMIDKQCQEQIVIRLYVLLQIYHFIKGDPVTVAAKFKLKEDKILSAVSRNDQPGHISQLVLLDPLFQSAMEETVNKRCRPFINKRDSLESKVREILRQGESKVGTNFNLFVDSLISKERLRIGRQISMGLSQELKQIEEGENEAQIKQLIDETDSLKREFANLKNTTYFLDIMRGSFSEKYKMDINRLENIFYLSNLEKYLQDVASFLEKLLQVEEKIIRNRKDYMRSFGNKVEVKIYELISRFENKSGGASSLLLDVINEQFQRLQSALYGVVHKKESQEVRNGSSDQKAERQRRENAKRRQMQERKELQRQRRQEDQRKMEEKRRTEQERLQRLRLQKEENQRKRNVQNQKMQEERKRQLERKREQNNRKDEEQKRLRQIELKKKEEDRKKQEETDKIKREEMARKRQEDELKKKQLRQEQNKRKEEDKRKIIEREEEERNKKQAELKERRKKQEEEKIRRQKQKKIEDEKLKRQKQQREAELKKKEEERIKIQNQKKQKAQREAEERKKQDEKGKKQRQKRQKEQKQAEEKKKEEQRLKAEKDKKEKEKKQAQDREKREKEKKQRQAAQQKKQQQRIRLEKEKRQKQQAQKAKKAEQDRLAKQKEEKKKKEDIQKAKQEREKQQKDEKERKEKERVEKQRVEKERIQKQKKEKERLEKERQEKQRQEKERQQKQKQEKERIEREKQQKQKQQREKKERQQKQAEQRKKQEEKARMQKQRKDREKKEIEQKAKLQKEKKEKQERQKKAKKQMEQRQQKEEEERAKRQKQQKEKSKGNKKNQPKKSSGMSYGDDLEDMLDDDLDMLQKDGKLSPGDADDYGDDFQPEKGEANIKQLELISPADIKCLNDYMRGTAYSRKNKANAELVNNRNQYHQVFEEMILSKKIFIFDSACSKAILDFAEEITNPDIPQDDLTMSCETIREEVFKMYNDVFPQEEMFPETRFVFTFSIPNLLKIKLVEMGLQENYFRIVVEEPLPQDEESQNYFQYIVEAFMNVFQLEGDPSVELYVINEESRAVLGTFDKQMPCLLLLFSMYYEHNFEKEITINQYTIERFFYTSHPLQAFEKTLQQPEQFDEFYSELSQKYETDDKIKITDVVVSTGDQKYSEQLLQSALAIKQEFLKAKQNIYLASFCISILDEQGEPTDKVVVYVSLEQASPKPVINYFMVTKDQMEMENAAIIFQLISKGDDRFEATLYTDYTRHGYLGSYCEYYLPLWAHIITKRKLSSIQAMRAMTFAITPLYLAFKQFD